MAHPSQFHLLAQRRFGPFFLTQLGGAFNDNLLKQMLVLLVTYHASDYTRLAPAIITSLAGGIFILPFVLFSAMAGQLADRYDKAVLIRLVKVAEVAIMAVAAAGFYGHSLGLLLLALFLMGTHSSFFGPAKYSLLPRVLEESELVGGNGLLEMGTFVSILTGTLCAGVLVAGTTDPLWLSLALLLVAALGLCASLFIPPNGCAAPELRVGWNLFGQTSDILRRAHRIRPVWLSLLGISWFWFFGAAFLSQLPILVREQMHGAETVVTLLLGVFAVGVAIGSLMCERLSGGRVEWGLVPLGSIGMTLFAADLALSAHGMGGAPVLRDVAAMLADPATWRVLADICLLGFFGGIFSVPLYATIQARADRSEQSRVIAANNVLNALFMVVAALMGMALAAAGLSPTGIVAVCAVLNAAVAAYIYGLLPEFLWRFFAWVLVHTVYRVRVEGEHHIPASGAALLAPNHVSYVDALLLSAVSPRPVRFVMDHAIFRSWLLGWLFRAVGAIPIASSREAPEVLAQAHERIAASLQDGELVCIFPEGRLTPDGNLQELRRGIVDIVERTPVPVIPVALIGLEGSTFSRSARHPHWRGNPFTRHVGVAAAAPLKPGSWDLAALRERLTQLLVTYGSRPAGAS